MNTQKGFASILIILLGLIVVGGGAYVYTQNNQEEVIKSKVIQEDPLPVLNNTTEIKQSKSIYEDKSNNGEVDSIQSKNTELETSEKFANDDLVEIREIKQSEEDTNKYKMTGEVIEVYWEEGLPNPGLRTTGVLKTTLVNKSVPVQTIHWDNKEPREIYFDEFAKIFNQKPEYNRCDIFIVDVEQGIITRMEYFCGV